MWKTLVFPSRTGDKATLDRFKDVSIGWHQFPLNSIGYTQESKERPGCQQPRHDAFAPSAIIFSETISISPFLLIFVLNCQCYGKNCAFYNNLYVFLIILNRLISSPVEKPISYAFAEVILLLGMR